jgi:hypothetical protein
MGPNVEDWLEGRRKKLDDIRYTQDASQDIDVC